MDHVGNWVRFADTKSTILIAGLGVLLTMVMTNGDTIAEAVDGDSNHPAIIYTFGTLTLAAFLWTLVWLIVSISARRTTTTPGINRFAWPTLTHTSAATLIEHTRTHDVRQDAWNQVADLAGLANTKFHAFNRAIAGFAVLMISAAALVGLAIATTTQDPASRHVVPDPTQPRGAPHAPTPRPQGHQRADTGHRTPPTPSQARRHHRTAEHPPRPHG